MRKGSDANTVPGSTRCRPSTRMSRRVNGSTAQAGRADSRDTASAESDRLRQPFLIFFMERVCSARQTGHIIEQGYGHECHQHNNTTALQALHPDIRYAAP